jgi:hypothetical protein
VINNDESPRCVFCDHQTGIGTKSLLLRVGHTVVSQRHGKFFKPHKFEDGETVRCFHEHCIFLLFDFCNTPSSKRCEFCRTVLSGTHFEFEFGEFVICGNDTVWMMSERCYGCYACTFFNIGEGDKETSRFRLGMKKRYKHDWIAYDDIPKSIRR